MSPKGKSGQSQDGDTTQMYRQNPKRTRIRSEKLVRKPKQKQGKLEKPQTQTTEEEGTKEPAQ